MAGFGAPWTEPELAVLREKYVVGGSRACAEVLPRRSQATIQSKAKKLGIRVRDNQSRFQDWPIGVDTGRPLRDAIIDVLVEIRNCERVSAAAIDTLKHVVHYNRVPSLSTVIESAELLGFDLSHRAGWLEFANLVAARMPEEASDDNAEATESERCAST